MWFNDLLQARRRTAERGQEGRLPARRTARRRALQQQRFVPRLEILEDRTVLSTLTVTSTADDGAAGTFRSAIASASPGDTIRFARKLHGHTITLTRGELALSKNLDIEGPGAERLTVSGNHASRVFDVSGGATVTIAGLTIADGVAQPADVGGGGIVNQSGATLNLINDELTANLSPGFGGGLWNKAGATAHVSGCTFADNQAIGVLNVVVPTWSVGGGAGIESDGTLTVLNSTFIHNRAIGGGGAVLSVGAGGGIESNFFDITGPSLTVVGSTFEDNLAAGGPVTNGLTVLSQGLGGGIENEVGNLSVRDSTFTGNSAIGGPGATSPPASPEAFDGSGGGILSFLGTTVTVSDSSFTDNRAVGGAGGPGGPGSAGGGGGLMVSMGSQLTLSDSSFSHNAAIGGAGGGGAPGGVGVGGGLVIDAGSTATITNISVTHNLALGGAGTNGGAGLGAGLSVGDGNILFGRPDNSSVTLSGSTLSHNLALGGGGESGGNGGNGFGGGAFVGTGGSLSVAAGTIAENRAIGGSGDDGGSDGQGIGGGVYHQGTFTFDGTTVIQKNHASTSNDDVFP